jgi:hypothetical protein
MGQCDINSSYVASPMSQVSQVPCRRCRKSHVASVASERDDESKTAVDS